MNPKVFISYSWHPEENKVRVQRLAERLMGDGVNVILDVWDLKNGQDKYVFMEQMVEDSEIKRSWLSVTKTMQIKLTVVKEGLEQKVLLCPMKSILRPIRQSLFRLFLKK